MQSPSKWIILFSLVALAACATEPGLPDDGFVDVRDARLAFRVLGDGPGAPVIMIHGGPGLDGCVFEPAVTRLSQTRPVIVYDQIGAGYSSWIPEDRLAEYAEIPRFVEEIAALREELGLAEVHLVGSSWGTAVALEYLLAEGAGGVLSVSFVGPYFSTERWIADTDRLLETLSDSSQLAIAAGRASGDFESPAFAAANREFSSLYGLRTPPDEVNWGAACDWAPYAPSQPGMYEYMWGPSEFVATGTLQDYDRIEGLRELRLPALFVRAEFDEVSDETIREYTSMVEGSEYVTIAGAAHNIYVDQPAEFDRVLTEFMLATEGR